MSQRCCPAAVAAFSGGPNYRRRNGMVPPDGLLPHWPNLQLEGTEVRSARRLDAVLSTWLEEAVADGSQPGLLWLPATQAPQMLGGAGDFLERLATIWLGRAPPNDGLDVELVERLEVSCHRLEREGPNHQLWRLDGQRLVERELLLVTQQREALLARCEELEGQLSAQVLQNTDYSHQRKGLQARVEELQDQCDRLILENTQAAKERDQELSSRREEARSQLEFLSAQRDGMQHERDQLSAERDTLQAERERMEMERQQLLVALNTFPL